ncbi:MAG TPA: phasin family protein [Thermoanaerobaculia bacterium]|jgi:poly(hydroxyalkanoate) granule-associated protein|nr:phasin family protein [Thermoanaerobaculia bacterium]
MSEAQMDTTSKLLAAGRNLWLAGLGAVAEVEEGTLSLFDRLVAKGRPVEERQKKAVEAVAEKARGTAMGLSQLVQDTVEYESRQMLKRLNVMTREDVKILSARLETLSTKIDEYVARRSASTIAAIEIISPEGEAAAIVIPETIETAR